MPSGTIDNHEDMNMFRKSPAEVLKVQTHDARIETIEEKSMLFASRGPNRSNDVRTLKTILPRQRRAQAFNCPYFRYDSLLTKPGFVLEPDLDGFVAMELLFFPKRRAGFFFQSSIARGSFFG